MKGFHMFLSFIRVLLAAAILAAALASGCGDDSETSMKDVKESAEKAVNTAMDYSKEQKEKFMQEIGQHWNSVKGDVDQLQDKLVAKGEEAGEKASAHWEAINAGLKAKQEAVSQAYDELSQASGDAYDKAKKKLEAALAELKAAYEKAAAELQK
jgi:ElaB/YqjD/DUF883 family membrane-anchored ribosome-binding protein